LFPDHSVLKLIAGTDPATLPAIKRVTIFGPGLIGGSIALALRSRCPETFVAVWGRNQATLREISERGLADSVTSDPTSSVGEADLIVFCTPIAVMPELAATITPHLDPHTLITDAGSVKSSLVKKLSPIFGDRFLGAHPMAGSERSGLAAARADLFVGAPCILTPLENASPQTVAIISAFWNSLGSHVTMMTPEAHDRLVARVSHLPHALAFALVNLIADTLPKDSCLLAGGSYRDGTRVAASDPDLWTGILMDNRTEVAAALREMSDLLGLFAEKLEVEQTDSILDFLTRAKKHRDLRQTSRTDSLPTNS